MSKKQYLKNTVIIIIFLISRRHPSYSVHIIFNLFIYFLLYKAVCPLRFHAYFLIIVFSVQKDLLC